MFLFLFSGVAVCKRAVEMVASEVILMTRLQLPTFPFPTQIFGNL